jgi:hypothetical protein
METSVIYGEDWLKVRSHLPIEIEEMAVESGALVRRRQIRTAEMLLRILLSYVCGKNSLEKTVASASRKGWAKMSANALHLRLRNSEGFIEKVLLSLLSRTARITSRAKRRIRIVDATFLSAPGASTSDFTLHMQYDPSSGRPVGLELADGHSGESFRLHKFCPGDLVLGDRAYGKCRGIDSVLQQGADVLVRLYVPNIRLVDADGATVKPEFLASQVPAEGHAEFEFSMPVPPEQSKSSWKTADAVRTHPVRVIATRIDKDEIMWLLTNLKGDDLSAQDALAMYRERWQIELFFKRLKSILDLDELPTRDPTSARPWILLKVIAAILALRLSEGDFFPCAAQQEEEPQQMEEHERRVHHAHGVSGRADPHRQTPPKRPAPAQNPSAQATLFLADGLAAVPA